MAWTSSDLVTAVLTGMLAPTANGQLTSADILLFAHEEQETVIAPWMRGKRGQGYLVRYADQTLVSGTAEYRIPARAQGASLADVTLRNAAGDEISLPEEPLERRGEFASDASALWPDGIAFCVEGDRVVLLPTPASSWEWTTLRLRYQRRPSRLVVTTAAMQVTSVSGATLNGTAPSWTTATALDLVEGTPNFDVLAGDVYPSSVSAGVSVTFTSAPSSEVAAGDWLAQAGETPVIQLPAELHPILAALTRARCLEARKELSAASYARENALVQLERLRTLVAPRVEGAPRVMVARQSPLRVWRQR